MEVLRIFLLLIFVGKILAEKNFEINLIEQVLQQHSKPSTVTGFLCWEKDDLVKLQLMLSRGNYLSNLNKVFDISRVPYKENQVILLDFSCENAEKLIQKAGLNDYFRVKFRWLIFTDENNYDKILDLFKTIEVLPDSKVTIIKKISDSGFLLNYFYKIRPYTDIIIQHQGSFDQKGLKKYDNYPVSWTRKDLRGQTVRTSLIALHKQTLQHLDDYRFANVDTQTKLNYALSSYLFQYMNATMDLSWDRGWGEYLPNGSYTGMLGRIQRKEIDISSSPLFCVKERLGFYDCVAMTTPAIGFFLFKQPPLSYVANIYTLPFETNLWLTDIAFLLVCAVFMYFVVVWEWKLIENKTKDYQTDMIEPSFWESIMFTIGTVCQQGYATEPKSGSGKIIVLTLCFTLIFMFTAFSANTVVLFQSSASNIKTLEDLYNSKMTLGVDDTLYYRVWFPRTFEYWRRKIYLERVAPKGEKPHFLPLEEGIQKMRTGYYAFHTDEVSGYKVISDNFEEHEKCGLQTISYLYVSNPWVTTPKNSSYRKIFSVGYRLIQERGLQRREIKKLYVQKPECVTQGSNFRSAGILDLYSVYMLFFFGLSGAVLLLLLEIFSSKCIEPRIAKKIQQRMIAKRELQRMEGIEDLKRN